MVKQKQNWGIALTCILIWIGAATLLAGSLFAILMGGTLASFGISIGLPDFSALISSAAYGTLAFGLAYLFLGIFLWFHNKYAWYITLALLILSLVVMVPTTLLGLSIVAVIGVILVCAEFLALTNKDAMRELKVNVAGWKGSI